jgi:hypothetical protein
MDMTPRERAHEIIEMIDNGATKREVATRFGISIGYVTNIVREIRFEMSLNAERGDKDELCALKTRTRNGLGSIGVRTRDELVDAIKKGDVSPDNPRIRGFGEKSFADVVEFAKKHLVVVPVR